jgi:hypothetical protein
LTTLLAGPGVFVSGGHAIPEGCARFDSQEKVPTSNSSIRRQNANDKGKGNLMWSLLFLVLEKEGFPGDILNVHKYLYCPALTPMRVEGSK